jgi:hypothetical protein
MPLRVLRFLEDARHRQILRVVGPLYQFRHPWLHDHFTAQYEEMHRSQR